jgi:hypothetical protein
MAYPTIDKPYGLEPINLKGGIPFAGSTRMIPIGQGYATNIFNGDVVGLSNGNAIITPYNADTQSAAAAGDIVGVFLGCEYSTGAGPIYGKLRQQYYPASTNAPNAVAYVLDDPNALHDHRLHVAVVPRHQRLPDRWQRRLDGNRQFAGWCFGWQPHGVFVGGWQHPPDGRHRCGHFALPARDPTSA